MTVTGTATDEHGAVELDLPWPPARVRDLHTVYAPLWAGSPVVRVRLTGGQPAWLATRHAEVRAVLAGRQFAMRAEPLHRGPAEATIRASRILRLDGAEHRRVRGVLMRVIDGRAHTFAPLVEAAVREHLDRLAAQGGPADLVAGYALAVPLLVTARLLGLPIEDRRIYHDEGTAQLLRIGLDPQYANDCAGRALDYVAGVVRDRTRRPADDLISDLLACPGLSEEEVVEEAVALLIAGYEAPAGMIAKGVVEILADPALRAAVTGDPAARGRAVEELLRHITIVQYGVDRVATEDVVLGGQRIRRGETVIALLPAANRDPELTPRPGAMDAGCPARGHVAFGHGPHFCLGQDLSRTMLELTLARLFERFPGLRLTGAQPAERDEYVMGGYHRLEVTW